MVETGSSLRYNAANKLFEARREHSVDSKGKKHGTNRRNSYDGASTGTRATADRTNEREDESSIDTDYRIFVLHKLKEEERNAKRRNGAVKERVLDKNLGRGVRGTSCNDVLPVLEKYEINDRGKRERENFVHDDVNGYGGDPDPEFLNVLACLKEYGNAYALQDGDNGLIAYEGECSSDDVSDRKSPTELGTNHEPQMDVNSVDDNPRVDLVIEGVNKGQKGILRKRNIDGLANMGNVHGVAVQENSRKKINGLACMGTVHGVAVQGNSRDVLNQKRLKLTSKKSYVEKNQRNILKEKNVVQKEVEEDFDSHSDSDDGSDSDEDDDVDVDEDSDDDDYDGDDSEDDSEDAYDYEYDDDYHPGIDNEYSRERNLGKRFKGKNVVRVDDGVKKKTVIQQNKKYLNRSCPIHLVMKNEKPSIGKSYKIPTLGKSNKMDKGKNMVSEVKEAKAKQNKWFKQENRGSIGPSWPYKQKIMQSANQLKENVKQEKILKIAVKIEKRESDTDSDEVEILDDSDIIKEGGCFVPSKNIDQNGAGGPNGCADYRQKVLRILNEPYDANEYRRLSEEVNVYVKTFPDLKGKLAKNRYWVGKRLPILRGFFYWLQKSPHDGAFKPWKDAECLSVNLKTPKA